MDVLCPGFFGCLKDERKVTAMRRLLAIVLVVGIASVAGAEVLTLKVVDIGASQGRTGGETDPLMPSDVVGLEIWLQVINPNAQYGGYWIDGLDISVDVESGPGSLDLDLAGIDPASQPGRLYGNYEVGAVVESPTKIAIDGEATYNGWTPWDDQADDGEFRMFGGFLFHCDGWGTVVLDINLDGPTVPGGWKDAGIGSINYASTESGWWKYPGFARYWGANYGVFELTDAHLGSVIINQIPEPIALGILALGGLALLRKRRA